MHLDFVPRLLASVLAVVSSFGTTQAAPNDSSDARCPMDAASAALTISDTQDGVAGPSGVVWTIASDCSFSVARQVGGKTISSHRQGWLTPSQRATLGELLSTLRERALPKQFGKGPSFNARRITIAQGDALSVLLLPPGSEDVGALKPEQVDLAAHMLLLARALKETIGQ